MKQNERLLVYAVTGFLALILVVAVLFSREPGKDQTGKGKAQGLDQILGQEQAGKDGKVALDDKSGKEKAAMDGNRTGLPGPGDVTPQPLAAGVKPMLAADLVAQQLGMSRRDRMVRFVHAKANDSLESIVKRWCGARDPYLAETRSLNEDLKVLRVGQEVAVPWVEDEVVLAAIEAAKPRMLAAQDAVAGGNTPSNGTPSPASLQGVLGGNANGTTNAPANAPANGTPTFAQPGTGSAAERGRTPALGSGTSYTVKDKDSLWRIAERTYGKQNADRMIKAILEANPGLTESLRPGQKITLPAAAATGV